MKWLYTSFLSFSSFSLDRSFWHCFVILHQVVALEMTSCSKTLFFLTFKWKDSCKCQVTKQRLNVSDAAFRICVMSLVRRIGILLTFLSSTRYTVLSLLNVRLRQTPSLVFMVTPWINNIQHFNFQLMHTTLKNVELLKYSKISKTAPTCFGLQGNHLQGATVST